MTTTLPDVLPSLGYAAPPRFHPAIWPLTTRVDDEGRLCIGEVPLAEIADGAKYTVALANRHSLAPRQRVTVAGRHCESGDELARDVELPVDLHPGDLLAVACTGAYHHSMASNYNMVGRPPLVAVKDGRARELVRRETTADLLSRDTG